MSSLEIFIRLVAEMREAQRAFFDQRTSGNLARAKQAAQKVDEWLIRYTAEQVQFDLWTRSVKSSESAGVYNIAHDSEAEEESAA